MDQKLTGIFSASHMSAALAKHDALATIPPWAHLRYPSNLPLIGVSRERHVPLANIGMTVKAILLLASDTYPVGAFSWLMLGNCTFFSEIGPNTHLLEDESDHFHTVCLQLGQCTNGTWDSLTNYPMLYAYYSWSGNQFRRNRNRRTEP
jgi:hypothetical protein